MVPAAPTLRRLAIATLLAASACNPAPTLEELPPAPLPVEAAPAVTLESAKVVGGRVVVTYALADRGAPITGANATALAPAWTLAWLDVEPVSGLPAWRSLILTGAQTVPSLPPAGPGTPAGQVIANARQPGSETGGAVADLGGGRFTYTFVDALPGAHPLGATLRVGVFLGGVATGTALTSATLDFVPSGAALQSYGSVSDDHCNGCHGRKFAHGGKRTGVKLCLTCHTWLNADPDTVDAAALNLGSDTSDANALAARAVVTKGTYPNPLELGRLIHRIHRGSNLPTLYRSASCYTSSTKTGVTQLTSSSTVLCNVPTVPPTFPPNGPPPAPPLPPADLPWTVPALPFRPARNALGPAGIKASIVGEGGVELVVGRVASRITNDQAARTLATGIGYPQDLRNCSACHDDDPATGVRVTSISRRTCSGCHPDVWFGVVSAIADLDAFHMPHGGGPQADDTACRDCHVVKGSQSRWAPIAELHLPPVVSPRWKKPVVEIVDVQSLSPGAPGTPGPATATIRFKAYDAVGTLTPLNGPTPANDPDPVWPSPVPRKLTSLTFRIGGPNTDIVTGGGTETVGGTPAAPTFSRAFSYTATCSTSVLTLAADANGVFTCTFANPLANLNLVPGKVEAQGSWTVGVEGRRASAQTQYTAPAPYTGTVAPNRPADWPWYGWVLGYDGDPGSPTYDTFRWPGTGETVTEAIDNAFVSVDLGTGRIATQPSAARRPIVAIDRCNACHLRLTFHGARTDSKFCVFCHAPDATDWMYRPRDLQTAPVGTGQVLLWNPLEYPATSTKAWTYWTVDGIEERSINLKAMIHRIHTGDREGPASLEGIRPFAIHTSAANGALLDEARFPNVLANCEVCHLPGTWRIESVPADAMPTIANENPFLLHLPRRDALGSLITPAATSPDGSTWTSRTMAPGSYGGVAWGGTPTPAFAAVGAGVAATSPDGATWTARTIPAGSYAGVAWSGTTFAAVGASVAATSPDGVTWTSRTIPAKSYGAVAWGGAPTPVFVAVGASAAATSPDGVTWTASTIPAGTYASVAWSGTTFVAVGAPVSPDTNLVATSPDGVTWTKRTIPAGSYVAVAWGGSAFVAVGTGLAATSPDGVTWTARTIPVAGYRDVDWNGTRFVAIGADAAVTSPDGIAWTWRTMPAGGFQKAAWSGTVLAAVGYAASAAPEHDASEAVGAVTSACLTCHASGGARKHDAEKTPGGVEQCVTCHGEDGAQSVRRSHAVP